MTDIKDGGPAFPRTTEQVSNRTDAPDYQALWRARHDAARLLRHSRP